MAGTSVLKAGIVVWPNLVTTYIMSIIASYLTDVWELSITNAAAIVNIYTGVVAILRVGLICIIYVTGYVGSYWMILLSRFAYTSGLVLLTLSAPPVLSWATGTCTSLEAECIGQVQKILFYISLPLIALGKSAYYASTLTFIDEVILKRKSERLLPPSDQSEQLLPPSDQSEQLLPPQDQSEQFLPPQDQSQQLLPPPDQSDHQPSSSTTSPESDATDEGSWGNTFASYFTSEKFFGAVLLILFPAAALLAIGYIDPWSIKFGIGATFTVVSTITFLSGLPTYPHGPQPRPIALTKMFRIQSTKSLLTLMSTFVTCLLTGVIISIGNTYFIEQATDLNHYLGSLWVPVIIFPNYFQELAKKLCAREIKWCAYVPKLGIAASLVFATLCCITAAKVETRRLGIVESEGVSDDPTSIIAMSMFWLLPQFILLGLAEDVSEKSVINMLRVNLALKTPEDDADAEETKESKDLYMTIFAQAVSGVGIVCGVLSAYVVGEISEKVGGTSWFQYTLNKSRLDNYYWVLAALAAANLVLHLSGLGFLALL